MVAPDGPGVGGIASGERVAEALPIGGCRRRFNDRRECDRWERRGVQQVRSDLGTVGIIVRCHVSRGECLTKRTERIAKHGPKSHEFFGEYAVKFTQLFGSHGRHRTGNLMLRVRIRHTESL
jgi:hypothetical protein